MRKEKFYISPVFEWEKEYFGEGETEEGSDLEEEEEKPGTEEEEEELE